MSSQKKLFSLSSIPTILAGSIASLLTQPFQVLKTNMINSPSLYLRDLHFKITQNGWIQYMRGGTLAFIRQGYGFAIYTTAISTFNKQLDQRTNINKYYKYSISAFTGKMIAMLFQAPLTLLKTRMEVLSNSTITEQIKNLLRNPRQQMCKGYRATIARQGVFSLIHYNSYRFLKDDIFSDTFRMVSTFYPAFLAGILAITFSQPFEVIRSKISLQKNITIINCIKNIFIKQGWRGFFIGFLPRLCRKPINSGICWSILQTVRFQ